MSFIDCIRRALDDGATDAERAKATQDAWREQADRYSTFHDRRTAEEMAYEDVKEAFRKQTAIDRRMRLADLEIMRRNVAEVNASDDLAGVIRRPIERLEGASDQLDSVWFTSRALEQQFQGMMGEFFTEVHRDVLGRVKQKARLGNVIRQLHGEQTGDAVASSMTQAIQSTFERARSLFNEAGGHIEKLEDWGLPHTHDRTRIERAGFDAWFEEVSPRIDWNRIENNLTGRPFADAPDSAKRDFLHDIYHNITTSDVPRLEPRYGPMPGNGKLGNEYAYQRVLHFKSADDWMAYNDRFGAADAFGSISRHLKRMSRDIALMRTFGTNPRAGLEHRAQVAMKRAADMDDRQAIDQIKSSLRTTRAMLDQVNGTAATPVNEMWANFFSGIRQWTTASYLGGAMLSSGGDLAAMRLAAKAVGMNPRNVMSRHVSLMARQTNRETAAQLGYIADTLTDAGNTLARYLGEVPTNEIMERVTSFTMRAQGLSFWTDMARTAFRMEFAALYARNAGRSLSDVEPELRKILTDRGVTEQQWELFSNPDHLFDAGNGARFLSPTYWLHHTDAAGREAEEIAIKMGSIIEEQVEFAVPTMSVYGRSLIQGQTRPGELTGEVALSALQFKSFGISTWINQSARMMAQPTGASRWAYLFDGVASFALMGALSIQIKEMAKGNDPRDMTTLSFWGAATLQGGGFGVVGDLLNTANTRMGGGLAGFVAGPTIGFLDEASRLTLGNFMEAWRGEETNFGRDLSKFVRRNTPVLSSYWPTRAAMDNMLWDRLQMVLDPEAERSMRTAAQRRYQEYGNRPFWEDGEALPSRAPDLSSALGR